MSVKRLRYLAAVVVTLGLAACSSTDAPAPAAPSDAEPSPVASASVAPSGEPSPSGGVPSIDDILHEEAATIAQGYLDIMGFSRDRLVAQMHDGDGIPTDVAASAVDSLGVDWNEQAVRSAEQYISEGMTRAELVQQLTSTYDQYTLVQAEYAADAVGQDAP